METNEKLLFSNSFGTVTDKRIILNYKSGAEDLPLGHITSVSYQRKRNYVFAIVNILIPAVGLNVLHPSVFSDNRGAVLTILMLAIASLFSGIANLIGHHNIVISAGGKDRKPLKAEMSQTREGREFVDAVKRAMIK
jgi:hypothetical protein